ncbi:uncharacterized protein BX664DRAFT_384764 [Halteromyces radiatus]|uniref:uncharacterized protein n=1 Tax=Halteromyces radiatus TaxID=101107 RepID=UPI002220EA30|nr:uncharacterized protein BX664DRAFT_384764 [Halteromyces radiatus]KAI8093315.1 hypothetical protein BX664DRAFT_384764 [Halteromyces radiatus]
MPNDPSSDQITDIYQNDPYRSRRTAAQNSVTWQCPSKSIHSYLPYSNYIPQQQKLYDQQEERTRICSLDNGFHVEQEQVTGLDKRQDSLLTTITSTARSPSTLATHHPLLQSTMTTMSLSEEIRKKKYHQTSTSIHSLFLYCCQGRLSWRWVCFILTCFMLCIGGVLLFICLPRLPIVTMAPTADTFGQESADWGPPLHPFYRTTWQLNLTLDNHPNFIPLHLVQMDLVLFIHPSNNSASSNPDTIPINSTINANKTTTNHITEPSFMTSYTNNSIINDDGQGIPFAWSTLPAMTLWTDGQPQVVRTLFHIDYVATTSNLTDPTFAQLYSACGPHLINNPPALNLSLHITFHLLHYLWLPTMTIYPSDGNGLICPTN